MMSQEQPPGKGAARHVLIVEDDEAMCAALHDGFQYEGYSVALAKDGAAGLRLAVETSPDLIILDVMLPRLSGLDLCRRLRERGVETPVIMLTARGQEIDKVLGLKSGADDYVTKPFSFMELLARVEAVLRRSQRDAGAPAVVRIGEIEIDFARCEARRKGRPFDISARELRLIEYMVQHQGRILTREQLLRAVWGYESDSASRTVDVHIAKLRKKIEERPDEPRHIITVHGLGYKFLG